MRFYCLSLFLVASTVPALAQQARALDRPASAYINRELPKWLKLSGEFRARLEGRTAFGYREGNDDAYVLSRLRVNVDLKPTSWMQMLIQGQDSRVGWIDRSRVGPLFKDTFDLRQAYLYLRGGDSGPVGVRVGRQDLLFGGQRLVGPLDWTNTARSFDAARVELYTKNARFDLFLSSVVRIDPAHFDRHRDGENFHGAYGAVKSVIPGAIFEPYLFLKTNPRVIGSRGRGSLELYTAGYRIHRAAQPGYDYSLEFARQWGAFASDAVSAWAGYLIAGYTVKSLPWLPRLNAEYSYASGDKSPGDGRVQTFDNLYPTNHLFYGLADLVGWQNIKNPRVGVELKPHKKWKLALDHHWFWLANRNDHLYNAGLGIAVRSPRGGARHTDVGRELDLACWYNLSSQMILGAGYGHLAPGRFLKENSPGSSTTFPYVFATYKF